MLGVHSWCIAWKLQGPRPLTKHPLLLICIAYIAIYTLHMCSTEGRITTTWTYFHNLKGLSVTVFPLGTLSIFLFTMFYTIVTNYILLLTMPLNSTSLNVCTLQILIVASLSLANMYLRFFLKHVFSLLWNRVAENFCEIICLYLKSMTELPIGVAEFFCWFPLLVI